MRLIDAEKLHKTRFQFAMYMDDTEALVPVNDVIRMIALAPTVDIDGLVIGEIEKFAERLRERANASTVTVKDVDNLVREYKGGQ